MTTGRIRPYAACLLTVALAALAPSAALGNPLLSGYGGAGQGEQALLGGGLVNGPSGPSSGGGSPAVSTSTPEGSATGASGGRASAPSSRTTSTHGSAPAVGSKEHPRRSSAGSRPTYTYQDSLTASRSKAGSQVLGLSGEDIIYVVLALGAMLVTGALTKRLVREPAGRAG